MRELTTAELDFVSGGGDECKDEGGNNIGGVTDMENVGKDLIDIYEGLVEATSHVIERVANAFK
jgi:hypothetical protein